MNEFYDTISNVARLYISKIRKERPLTLDDIREQVELASSGPGVEPLNAAEQDKLTSQLECRFQTEIGAEREIVGEDEGWSPWISQRRGSIDWRYWTRYKDYLGRGDFSEDVLARLESTTDRTLGLMGDPKKEESWDRRGLVVGLVQSGKTAHYVGVINKAVDAGYKIIVVLTGFTESLRIQTQDRLEKGVLGFSLGPSPMNPRDQVASNCGVHLVEPMPHQYRMDSVTTCQNDFKTGIANNFAIQVGGRPILFVIKKNASVLKNLLRWVTNFGTTTDADGIKYVSDIPLLVVDDESDVGSIDTKKGAVDQEGDVDPDHDPVKINKQIRKLLSLFDQSSYLGYTATPFANVLIHDLTLAGVDKEDGLLIGDDLFPKSFIVSLPTPNNHIGPTTIFGSTQDECDYPEGLPIVRTIDDSQIGDDREDYWMPASHKKTHVPRYIGEDVVSPSLREAILSFILVIAARKLRGQGDKHNSMLVHVTRFTDVQSRVFDQVERLRQDVVNRLRNNAGLQQLLAELRALWEDGEESFHSTTEIIGRRAEAIFRNPTHEWHDVELQLLEAASSIEVRTINGTAGDVLDYDDHKYGLNVIAIGGDKLARGLTLEGLSVSYFLRSSRMYDTLMQMGRWFGYRQGYLDLCRLYTTSGLKQWFFHIAEASEELRREFDLMADAYPRRTPRDFGLKVLSHPQMMVTSAVKMRYGASMQVSYQGTMVQTIDFSRKEEVVKKNWGAFTNLVVRAESDYGIKQKSPRKNSLMWSEVPGALIVDFLESYSNHSAAKTVRTAQIRDYVSAQQKKHDGLQEWTVLLSGGEGDKIKSDSFQNADEVQLVSRPWFEKRTSKKKLIEQDHFRIGVLTNPSDELVDISPNDPKWSEALNKEIMDWEKGGKVRRGKKVPKPTAPSGRFIRQVRDPSKGLLIVYPISPDKEKAETAEFPITGFAISFPSVDELGDTLVNYVVGNVYQKMELDFDE